MYEENIKSTKNHIITISYNYNTNTFIIEDVLVNCFIYSYYIDHITSIILNWIILN